MTGSPDHADQRQMEQVTACPYCGDARHTRAVSGVQDWFFHNVPGGFDFERCNTCASLWLSARLTAQDLPEAYATYYTHSDPNTGVAAVIREGGIRGRLQNRYIAHRFGGKSDPFTRLGSALFRRIATGVERLDAHHGCAPPAPARILDYGCGGGAYLRQMRALGYDVTGVDFDPVTLVPLRLEGIAAFSIDEVAQQDWTAAFDCITINHVIEHVADPAELVRQLAEFLKPGGVLFCEAPNAQAMGLDVFGAYWRGLEAPRHFSVPSRVGLSTIFANAGLGQEQWINCDKTRSYTWPVSLDAVPPDQRKSIEQRAASAPAQTIDDGEYLIVATRKLR